MNAGQQFGRHDAFSFNGADGQRRHMHHSSYGNATTQHIGGGGYSNSGGDVRGVVTPASIRQSMKPARDVEFEFLKKFQTDLFRVMTARKDKGHFDTSFTIQTADLDEATLDYLFDKIVSTLRAEKFFVVIGGKTARTFVVSWDPILTQESISQEEQNDKQSVASVRLRRYLRMKNTQKKAQGIAEQERQSFAEFQAYTALMSGNPLPNTAAAATGDGAQDQLQRAWRQQQYEQSANQQPPSALQLAERTASLFAPTVARNNPHQMGAQVGASNELIGQQQQQQQEPQSASPRDHQLEIDANVRSRAAILTSLLGVSNDDASGSSDQENGSNDVDESMRSHDEQVRAARKMMMEASIVAGATDTTRHQVFEQGDALESDILGGSLQSDSDGNGKNSPTMGSAFRSDQQ